MTASSVLSFKAGPAALEEIRRRGFSEERIGTIAGASGGAKWLVLSQLDRVIIERILPKLCQPVHMIGSSVGVWRFACYANAAPVAAIERFESAYLAQKYSENPDTDEITEKSRAILRQIIGTAGLQDILHHPVLRTHILTVRSRLLTASDHRSVLTSGLLVAAAANALNRHLLGAFFRRSLFYDARDTPPIFDASGFPMDRIRLTAANLNEAIVASGSIPLVLHGVQNIKGAPSGVYRDGGVIDYHLDLPLSDPDKITIFPHFFEQLIPGWFDKKLFWRRVDPRHTDRTVLICPSAEFIASLPNGKIPDRSDFVTMSPELRVKVWKSVIASCERLAEELNDVLDKGLLPSRLEPI